MKRRRSPIGGYGFSCKRWPRPATAFTPRPVERCFSALPKPMRASQAHEPLCCEYRLGLLHTNHPRLRSPGSLLASIGGGIPPKRRSTRTDSISDWPHLQFQTTSSLRSSRRPWRYRVLGINGTENRVKATRVLQILTFRFPQATSWPSTISGTKTYAKPDLNCRTLPAYRSSRREPRDPRDFADQGSLFNQGVGINGNAMPGGSRRDMKAVSENGKRPKAAA